MKWCGGRVSGPITDETFSLVVSPCIPRYIFGAAMLRYYVPETLETCLDLAAETMDTLLYDQTQALNGFGESRLRTVIV